MSQCPKCFEPLYACCCNVPEIDALETHKPPVQPRVMPDLSNIAKESLRNQYEQLYADALRDYVLKRNEVERLRAALEELAGDDTYIENLSEWHDTGKMRDGVQRIARRALEGKDG